MKRKKFFFFPFMEIKYIFIRWYVKQQQSGNQNKAVKRNTFLRTLVLLKMFVYLF